MHTSRHHLLFLVHCDTKALLIASNLSLSVWCLCFSIYSCKLIFLSFSQSTMFLSFFSLFLTCVRLFHSSFPNSNFYLSVSFQRLRYLFLPDFCPLHPTPANSSLYLSVNPLCIFFFISSWLMCVYFILLLQTHLYILLSILNVFFISSWLIFVYFNLLFQTLYFNIPV